MSKETQPQTSNQILIILLLSFIVCISSTPSPSPTPSPFPSPSCALNGNPCPTPTWPVEWNLTRSTICQPGGAAFSGYFYPPSYQHWGFVSLDWSVAVDLWLNEDRRNSTCEETLRQNCELLKSGGLVTRCFIYHNTELALEWIESQREVMYNPDTANYFLRFPNGTIYNEPVGPGDQYFWNFSNPEAAAYFISSIMTSVSDPFVDGTFLDDVTGIPSEHPEVVSQIGMSNSEVAKLQFDTQATNQMLIDILVKAGKYSWQAFGQGDTVLHGPNKTNCITFMRKYCQPDYQNRPLAFQMHSSKGNLTQTVASFLIVRPPYGWLGWGWESDARNWNDVFNLNVGEPEGICEEKESGIFTRVWSMGTVELNCNDWSAVLPFD